MSIVEKLLTSQHDDNDYIIIEAMLRYGGSFVQNLAQAWQAADWNNRARLKSAFPEYWKKYAEIAAVKVL